MNVLASTVVGAAFANCGVIGAGDDITAPQNAGLLADGLDRLNVMLDDWRTQYLLGPFQSRQVFDVVANQSTYTIGPGGDWDTVKPQELSGAGLLLNSSSPAVEIPRWVMTDQAYQGIAIKDLTSTLFTSVYFNATYADDLGTVFLWPTPTTAQNDAVLYVQDLIVGFASTTDERVLPAGYRKAIEWNLSEDLLAPYSVSDQTILALVTKQASKTLANIKRQNVQMSDLPTDPILTRNGNRRFGYNIQTGGTY